MDIRNYAKRKSRLSRAELLYAEPYEHAYEAAQWPRSGRIL